MKTSVIRVILKIAVVILVAGGIGLCLYRFLSGDYGWVLALFLFFKLLTTVLKIFGIIIRSVFQLGLSALKVGLLVYIIFLIV